MLPLLLIASFSWRGFVPSRREVIAGVGALPATVLRATALDDVPEVVLYDEVTRESCLRLTSDLRAAEDEAVRRSENAGRACPVLLRIQSGGGSLASALYLCDRLGQSRVPVWTRVEGIAASAASLIAVSGARRTMTRHSVVLIHQASIDLPDMKQDELEDEHYNLNILASSMRDIYLSHSRLDRERLDGLLGNERYLNARECLALGLVDWIE